MRVYLQNGRLNQTITENTGENGKYDAKKHMLDTLWNNVWRIHTRYSLFGPFVSTSFICANIIKPHFLVSPPRLALEENRFIVVTFRTRVLFSSGQSWIVNNVGHNSFQFIHFVSDFVHVNASILRWLFVVAIATSEHQNAPLLVFPGVKHVVAFLTELDAYKFGPSIVSIFGLFGHGRQCFDPNKTGTLKQLFQCMHAFCWNSVYFVLVLLVKHAHISNSPPELSTECVHIKRSTTFRLHPRIVIS